MTNKEILIEIRRFIIECPIDDYAHRWIWDWRDKTIKMLDEAIANA